MSSMSVLASVVILRIHEFARRSVSEQARLRAQLEAVVAVTMAELHAESRIVLDASDGVAIVVLQNPEGALRLAERALTAAAAGLPLAAGINHGAVQLAGDGKAEGMMGDGIAVAASVAQFAPPAQLRVSRAFRDALADAVPGREALLVPKGTSTDSSLRRHELFARDVRAVRNRARRYRVLSVAALVACVAAGIGWRISVEGQDAFVNGFVTKSQSYVRGLAKKVNF
jgi:class 3 adenylate cyclase